MPPRGGVGRSLAAASRVAIVTGTSGVKGIGRGIVNALLADPVWYVLGCDVAPQAGADTTSPPPSATRMSSCVYLALSSVYPTEPLKLCSGSFQNIGRWNDVRQSALGLSRDGFSEW
jgi:hypothetical protein